jgi:hypothetical protein
LMRVNGLLNDGKIVLPPPRMEPKVKQDAASILYALRETDGLDRLKPWFEEKDRDHLFKSGPGNWTTVSDLSNVLGFENAYTPPNFIGFDARAPAAFSMAERERLVGPISLSFKRPEDQQQENLAAVVDNAEIVVRIDERSWRVPIRRVLETVQKTSPVKPYRISPWELEAAPDLKLIIVTAGGELGDKPRLDNMLFWAVMRPP